MGRRADVRSSPTTTRLRGPKRRPNTLAGSSCGGELDAGWRRDGRDRPFMQQPSVFLIDDEALDAVAVLVGDIKPAPGWIDLKITRGLAARRLECADCGVPGVLIEPEYRDCIRSSIRNKDKSATWMDEHLRSRELLGVGSFRHRRQVLDGIKNATNRIISKYR